MSTRPDPLTLQDGDLDAEKHPFVLDSIVSRRGVAMYVVRDENGKVVDATQFKSRGRARDLCEALNRAWAAGFDAGSAARTENSKREPEKCEGCGAPATHHDVENVPLCKECFDECAAPAEDD